MDISKFYKNKVIVVMGGTGSIGSEIVKQLLNLNAKTIRIFSNSEHELWKTKIRFKDFIPNLRFLLGDIRDYERVKKAIKGADYVFNAAAIKHVPISEYNPMEAINVNIHGLNNIIEAGFENNVKNIVHISTDKAVNPTTVMGATKMLGERLCISKEMAKGTNLTKISSVRFGNVLGSRGSIIPLIKRQLKNDNKITLTDDKMRRFFLSITQAVDLVLKSTILAQGGEIFVLKMPTVVIKDLFDVIIELFCPKIRKDPKSISIDLIGSRLGEKLNEELISPIEMTSCYKTEEMYIIYPNDLDYMGYKFDLNGIQKIGIKINNNDEFYYSTKSAIPLKKEEIKKVILDSNLI